MIVVLSTEAIMAQLPSATVKNIRERVGRYLIGAPGRKGGIGRHSSNDLVTIFNIFFIT